jgi:hypothetical protein
MDQRTFESISTSYCFDGGMIPDLGRQFNSTATRTRASFIPRNAPGTSKWNITAIYRYIGEMRYSLVIREPVYLRENRVCVAAAQYSQDERPRDEFFDHDVQPDNPRLYSSSLSDQLIMLVLITFSI